MKFWVDAQLPPALAGWLATRFNIVPTLFATLACVMLQIARYSWLLRGKMRSWSARTAILSSLLPVTDLLLNYFWVTCGNISNRQLQASFDYAFPEALALLSAGQAIVEIG